MLYFLLAAGIVWGLPTIYLAYRFREYRKFLGGAFFVSCGTLLYLYFANVSVPLLGRNLVFTPESSGVVRYTACSERSGEEGSLHPMDEGANLAYVAASYQYAPKVCRNSRRARGR